MSVTVRWPLIHILTGKHFARFFIPPAARELRIDHRVSNRGVANSVLHKAQVCAGAEPVREAIRRGRPRQPRG
jgi:hypothetical protein